MDASVALEIYRFSSPQGGYHHETTRDVLLLIIHNKNNNHDNDDDDVSKLGKHVVNGINARRRFVAVRH